MAIGPVFSSSIPDYSVNPNADLITNPTGTDVAIGEIADFGTTVGVSDISKTGGKCAGTTINLGSGRFGGLKLH